MSGRVTGEPGRQHTGVHVDYAQSIRVGGGIPMILPPAVGASHAADAMADCQGLILTGGEDVDPSSYGEEATEHVRAVDPERDAFEFALFDAARDCRIPTLAICRGFQIVNVALGGSLWHDLSAHHPGDLEHDLGKEWHDRTHTVEVTPGTRTATALGCERFVINSFHHQAVREVASALTVTAVADDGVIEAAEGQDPAWWLVCVQWHPESFWREEDAPERGLFKALIREAKRPVSHDA